MLAKGETADGIEIVEHWNVTRIWELPELIANYGEKQPA